MKTVKFLAMIIGVIIVACSSQKSQEKIEEERNEDQIEEQSRDQEKIQEVQVVQIDYNKSHPELREGEVLLFNLYVEQESIRQRFKAEPEVEYTLEYDEDGFGFYVQEPSLQGFSPIPFEDIVYQTKRLGISAYDDEGNRLECCRPIFVQRWEWEERQKEIEE